MKIKVLSPDGVLYESEAESLRLCAVDGSIGIRKGMADTLIALTEGEMLVKNKEKEERIPLSAGFARVHSDEIYIFAQRK